MLEAEFPIESLPKLKKDSNRNHSTLERESNVESFFHDATAKDFLALKNLLSSVKDSKKRDKERNMNLLGLEIKRLEPQIQS